MGNTVIKAENLTKSYYIGLYGRKTLAMDLQSFYAKIMRKEDPNKVIGFDYSNIGKHFKALDDLSFEIKKGEAFGIIGHNGAGKSTLLKILSRITTPSQGTVTITGNVASMLEVGTGFHPELTGRENVYLNGAILGMKKAEVTRKFDEIVTFAEMEQFIDTPVKRYSSGMYVKLAFAVAAHLDSEILIMDEVLAVGDMKYQQKCIAKMEDVVSDEGRTVLFVSHNMNSVQQLCPKTMLLDHGKILYSGETEQAIQMYMQHFNKYEVKSDLSDITRSSNLNTFFRMTAIELLGKDNCVFFNSEKLAFRLTFESHRTLDRVSIRTIFRYIDDTTIGSAVLDSFTAVSTGNSYTADFEFELKNLPGGRYIAALEMYSTSETGETFLLDQVTKALSFDVVNDYQDLQVWEHKWWGHCRFNDLVLKEQAVKPL